VLPREQDVRAVIFSMGTIPRSWGSVRGGLYLAITAVSVLFVAVHALSAGAATGMVTGVVNDASERPLAGVAVRLESSDAQIIARTSTDKEGRFVFTDVPAGAYTVFAERGIRHWDGDRSGIGRGTLERHARAEPTPGARERGGDRAAPRRSSDPG
jgi:hypothetical protein